MNELEAVYLRKVFFYYVLKALEFLFHIMQSGGLLKISRTVRIDAYVVLKFVKYSDVGKFGPGA